MAVNVDTIAIARSLSYDMAMRNSLVAAAQEYAKAPQAEGKTTLPEDRMIKNLEGIPKHGLPIGCLQHNLGYGGLEC
jgi:hypothetical protein